MLGDHVHLALDREIRAIGGHYTLTKEARLPFRGREVLYLVGCAVIDSTCCGIGGLAYAVVPGFVSKWRYKSTGDGLPVSEVAPILDEALRSEIARLIEAAELVSQVTFLDPV